MTSVDLPPKIVIGIPTFRRPVGLGRALDSLARMTALPNLHILVIDSEGERGVGTRIVEQRLQEGYPIPLNVSPAAQRGLSQARNAMMDEAFDSMGADFLAMLDDDEWVASDWLIELMAMHKKTGADIVWGFIAPEFEIPPPEWTRELPVYHRPKHADGQTNEKGGAGHTLYARSVNADRNGQKIRFDPAFSLTGGEDTEFFKKQEKNGAQFAYASKAVSYEFYPASRITRRWVLQRNFRMGATDIRIAKRYPSATPFREGGKTILVLLGGLIVGSALSLAFWASARQMRGLGMVARQVGKISGLLGYYGQEYKVTHGH